MTGLAGFGIAVGVGGGVNTILLRTVSGAAATVPDLSWRQAAVLGFGTSVVGLVVGLAIQGLVSR